MKKKIILGLILLVGIIAPLTINAETTYEAKTFKQTLQEEDIAISDETYKETDKQITIYMFRGKGCGYCRAYLTFMNNILKDYGKYFKMVSFEVWYNENNAKLLKDVSEKMNNPAEGVPYIIIGDKVFAGYSEQYDEQIKEAIKTLYDTKKDKRKDIINEMNIKYNIEEDKATEEAKTSSKSNTGIIVLFNGLFVAIATAVIILFENNRFNKIEKKLNIIKKRVKKEDKEKKNID